MLKRALAFVLALVILIQFPEVRAAQTTFTDVKSGDWFSGDVNKLAGYGIISGFPDGSFKPQNTLTRGEFIRMLTTVAEVWSGKALTGVHWAESDWNALNESGILEVSTGYNSSGTLFPCTAKALDTPISRYEAAYLINAVLYLRFNEKQMTLAKSGDSFANHISDYNKMNKAYLNVVEQVYSKGILTGYADTSFQGSNSLKRSESAAVIVRLAWSKERKTISWATEKQTETDSSFVSFAIQYRSLSNDDRRQMLFGNANKAYFKSASDASGYMVTITVPVWKLNTSTGKKVSSTASLTVHKLVEKEVKAIFNDIYNSPEKFPINSIGGARYSDTMRHSWGCAIDINPNENYYINYNSGATVGSFCYKNGSSPFCITPDGSVVKAFAKYGWGWGGQGYSTAADYMHFSILASGG